MNPIQNALRHLVATQRQRHLRAHGLNHELAAELRRDDDFNKGEIFDNADDLSGVQRDQRKTD